MEDLKYSTYRRQIEGYGEIRIIRLRVKYRTEWIVRMSLFDNESRFLTEDVLVDELFLNNDIAHDRWFQLVVNMDTATDQQIINFCERVEGGY